MDIGAPLKAYTSVHRRHLCTLKDLKHTRGNDNFRAAGASLTRSYRFPKVSQKLGFEQDCKQIEPKNQLGNKCFGQLNKTLHTGNSLKVNQFHFLGHKGKFLATERPNKNSQTAKQKVYLRMVLNRPFPGHSKDANKDSNFDEDYLTFDNDLFSRYVMEESSLQGTKSKSLETEHSTFEPTDLRSGVKSGKCRLRRKYGDLDVDGTVKSDSFVKYGGLRIKSYHI